MATLLLGGCVAGDRLVEKVFISDEDIAGDVNIGQLGDAYTLSLNGLPIVGGIVPSQWTDSANGIEYTAGNVGIGLNAEANTLLSLYDNAGGAGQTVLEVSGNSASAGGYGINLSVLGAKTSTTFGQYIFNAATSSTDAINKYGLYIRSTSVWNGAGSVNYALYIEEPTGGTANYALYSAGGANYLGGATTINAALDMNSHQINNVTDPTLAQDAATKNYVDTGLGGIYVPYNGATGNVDLNAKNLTNVNTLGATTINAFTLGGNLNAANYDINNAVLNASVLKGTFTPSGSTYMGTAKFVEFSEAYSGAWYDAAYSRMETLTLDNTAGAASTLNAVIYVTLTAATFDYTEAQLDGSDVIFVDSDNATLLTSSISSWVYGGTSVFQLTIPNLTNTNYVVYCYWGA